RCMADWQRTHTCGDLGVGQVGQTVTLCGWIENWRHHGGIVFVDLRDRYGITQDVFDAERTGGGAGLFDLGLSLRGEDVVSVRGSVHKRDPDKINPRRITGAIEVFATHMTVLNKAETPPFEVIDDLDANEELRLTYRYLDLRRRPMLRAME